MDKVRINKILKFPKFNFYFSNLNKINHYYDEPRTYGYSVKMKNFFKYKLKKGQDIITSGISFFSREEALLKCLGEGIERLSLLNFKKNNLFSSFKNIKENALDPIFYIDNKKIRTVNFGWVNGYDLVKKRKILIPSQLIYLNYPLKNEPLLSPVISTGAAGGWDQVSTLLRGIYEVIERDAFMAIYLNKISPPLINKTILKIKRIHILFERLKKYNLIPYILDITTDIDIPVVLTLIIDTTGIGPPVTLGAKCNLDMVEAIIGSLEEAVGIRSTIRYRISQKRNKSYKFIKKISSPEDAIMYWSDFNNLKNINFLINSKPKEIEIRKFNKSKKNELSTVISLIRQKGYLIYYKDITIADFKKIGYRVYKVIIPGLQPLYFNDEIKIYQKKRLKKVAKYFNKNNYFINSIPHPFL